MSNSRNRNRAYFLIVLGLLILLNQVGINVWSVFGLVNWSLVGPLVLMVVGAALLMRRANEF